MKITLKTTFHIMTYLKMLKFDLTMVNLRRLYHFAALIVMTLIVPSSFVSEAKKEIVAMNTVVVKTREVYIDRNYLRPIESYLNDLGKKESSDNYTSRRIDKYIWVKKVKTPVYSQYWGRYQIGRDERKMLGLQNVSWETFSTHPELQDAACLLLIAIVRDNLKNYTTKNGYKIDYIQKYNGRDLAGWTLTESGLIAMAHNCGVAGLIEFLKSNGTTVPKDGLGTPATKYLTLANYNVEVSIEDAKANLNGVLDSLKIK